MKCIDTRLDGVKIIEPDVFGDSRGWFYESYSKRKFAELGIYADFVQDNRSFSSRRGTIRGLHFQAQPMAQAKLFSCTAGIVRDVAVDLRLGSPTFLQWVAVELSGENKRMLFIPRGFAHGFLTLTDNVEVLYKADEHYSKEHDGVLRFDDPAVGIDWGVDEPILSEKDKNAPTYENSKANFIYEKNV